MTTTTRETNPVKEFAFLRHQIGATEQVRLTLPGDGNFKGIDQSVTYFRLLAFGATERAANLSYKERIAREAKAR